MSFFEYRVVENQVKFSLTYDEGQGSVTNADEHLTRKRVVANGYYGQKEVVLAIYCEYAMGLFDGDVDGDPSMDYTIEVREEGSERWETYGRLRRPQQSDTPEGYEDVWGWFREH